MPHVLYQKDGRGNWWRTEWAAQCPEKAYIVDPCQGTEGHKGEHWAFSHDGSYHWSANKNEKMRDNIACGSTPPGNRGYKSPTSMAKLHYMNFKKTAKVTDKTIIAGLEKDKTPEKGATVDIPVDLDKLEPSLRKKILDRLKSIKR